MTQEAATKCPFHAAAANGGTINKDWWPNQFRPALPHQHSSRPTPLYRWVGYDH